MMKESASNRIDMPQDSRPIDLLRMLTKLGDVDARDFFFGVWQVEVFCEAFISIDGIAEYVEDTILGGKAPWIPQQRIGEATRQFTTDGHTLMSYSLYLNDESDFVAKFMRTTDQDKPYCELHFTEDDDLYVVCHDNELYWIFEEVRDRLKSWRF